jgi:hypothetical protein
MFGRLRISLGLLIETLPVPGNAFHPPGASQKHKRPNRLFRYNLWNAQVGARGSVWTILS